VNTSSFEVVCSIFGSVNRLRSRVPKAYLFQLRLSLRHFSLLFQNAVIVRNISFDFLLAGYGFRVVILDKLKSSLNLWQKISGGEAESLNCGYANILFLCLVGNNLAPFFPFFLRIQLVWINTALVDAMESNKFLFIGCFQFVIFQESQL
jgi:hypothetical protein